jgi:hypothetical protein
MAGTIFICFSPLVSGFNDKDMQMNIKQKAALYPFFINKPQINTDTLTSYGECLLNSRLAGNTDEKKQYLRASALPAKRSLAGNQLCKR